MGLKLCWQVTTPPVIPNLQDPDILKACACKSQVFNGCNVSYASAADITPGVWSTKNKLSVGELYYRLFEYFCVGFDWSNDVVSVRCGTIQHKSRSRARWRISIEDPFERNRDLGCRIRSQGKNTQIVQEFTRHFEDLQSVASGATDLTWLGQVI